jgi:hypothetical protein
VFATLSPNPEGIITSHAFALAEDDEHGVPAVTFPSFQFNGVRGQNYEMSFHAITTIDGRVVSTVGPYPVAVEPCPEHSRPLPSDPTTCGCELGYGVSGEEETYEDGMVVEDVETVADAACSRCPVGTYSSGFGVQRCTSCQEGQSTEQGGQTSAASCKQAGCMDATAVNYDPVSWLQVQRVFLLYSCSAVCLLAVCTWNATTLCTWNATTSKRRSVVTSRV